jgi:glycosyltransferase involved in cell wall biosynthesis
MLGLPLDGTLLLFGAASLSDPRKGFPHICEALPKEEGVELVLFGADQVDQTIVNVPIKHFGQISDERQMARLFAAADAYLCPTLEDNLPNTVIESLCCGTPVIGYATGGMVDMVIHGRNGLLAPTGSVECLRKLLSDFVSDPATRHALQQFDEKRYDFEIQARCVEKLYRERFGSQSSVTQGADLPELDCSWFRSAAVYAASRSNAQVSALRAKLEKSQLKLAQVKKAVESGPEKRKKRWWRF